jgi:hypothetical protein
MDLPKRDWRIYDPLLQKERDRIIKHNETCAKNRAKRKRKKRNNK